MSIFFHTQSGIKDWHLSIFVLVVMIIDILLIAIPTAFEGVRNTAKLIPRKENPLDEEGVSSCIARQFNISSSFPLPNSH